MNNRRSNLMIALYLGLVFAAGLAVGVLGQRLYASKTVQADSPRPTPEQWRAKYMADLQTRLKLNPEQVSKLTVILDETRKQYREIRERQKPDMKRVHDSEVSRIEEMLTDAQKAEYTLMRVEREKARANSARRD